jgi:hypothetical protein
VPQILQASLFLLLERRKMPVSMPDGQMPGMRKKEEADNEY